MKTGAVIAAAGISSQMNSIRPSLQLGGSTFIRNTVKTLKDSGIDKIVVVTGNENELVRRHLSSENIVFLFNAEYATKDMFYSACIGFDHIQNQCDRLFFLPADVPVLSCHSLIEMQNFMNKTGCAVLRPLYKGRPGHPVLLKSAIIPEIMGFLGDGGLKGALENYTGDKQTIELTDIGITIDTDKTEDRERLKAYVSAEIGKIPLRCSVNINLSRRNRFFNQELCELLRLVERFQSLHKACESIGTAYSKGWKMVKIAEHQLGFDLLDSKAGGSYGGGSVLTEKGLRMVRAFELLSSRVNEYADLEFQRVFSELQ